MPTFVDLFCGAGGLSLGLERAGWKQLLAVDHWSDAVSTYKQNFPTHQAIQADVSTLDETALRKLLPKSPEWVVGGPPCQGFSTVGRRERDDPRNRLVQEFARIVNLLSPTGFLVENVVGLRDMNFVDAVVDLFNGIGYAVTPLVLKSADYGVPQLRHRIIFVGSRAGQQFRKPKPHPAGIVTVWDAIGDLPPLAPGEEAFEYLTDAATGYQQRMRTGSQGLQGHVASSHPAHLVKAISFIPDGGNRLSIPDEFLNFILSFPLFQPSKHAVQPLERSHPSIATGFWPHHEWQPSLLSTTLFQSTRCHRRESLHARATRACATS